MKLQFDAGRCTGCQACQMACLDQWDIRPIEDQTPLCRIDPSESGGHLYYRFRHCLHCGKCAEVCPMGCLVMVDGIFRANTNKCIGCRACAVACPVHVITFDLKDGTVRKCDLCVGRIEAGLLPACVHTCPTGALSLV